MTGFRREEWLCGCKPAVQLYQKATGSAGQGQSRILVVGNGTSELAAALARAEPSATVVASDISAGAVWAMRRRTRGLPNLRWAVADATRLDGFEHGSFDVVVDKGGYAAVAVGSARAHVACLRAAWHVLSPEGVLLSITLAPPTPPPPFGAAAAAGAPFAVEEAVEVPSTSPGQSVCCYVGKKQLKRAVSGRGAPLVGPVAVAKAVPAAADSNV